ncbi:MAG: hypothetical protein K2M44_02300 [Clostridia bacterium]|nr:hypothetical protein [Clostridia bacterium]
MKNKTKKSKKSRNKKNGARLSIWVWVFIAVTVLVFLYCIASNIINHLEGVSNTLQIVFGLSDFANTAIGALLGFGASLLLDKYLIAVNKEKVIDNIVAEMTRMCLYISEMFDPYIRLQDNNGNEIIKFSDTLQGALDSLTNKANSDQYKPEFKILKNRVINHRYKIFLPIWDSVLQNGDLLRFKDREYFECLINIYTRLNKFRAQIDAFDASFENKELFEYLVELYSDVQSLYKYIKLQKAHLIFLCGYLKGERVSQLKTDFMSRFELDVR